ncbi:uncharacterized protein METZ01_LOCUS66056 [marine metagenome]|uniref:Uncharacterized protein n=1 Tax=marine metagenome TaxID=408172 RepID=A0A381TAK9_9ZZZZ
MVFATDADSTVSASGITPKRFGFVPQTPETVECSRRSFARHLDRTGRNSGASVAGR